ncbi:hypothetical protein Glove_579g33 [Diversispora epigaea]|uniref:SWIM-type domain-containing protein n=1 Tax=Diversispora epigaea TaxID=1348612 RepID=A0A397GAA0_9GLOM|nr:hypothetical protein Glove_579g33 [Diversispora epigaea]
MEANNASQQETEHEIEIPTVNILDSELEGLDSTKYPSLINPTELSIGSRFNSWEIAKHYLKEVEFYKCQSENSVRIVKKRTFSCEYSGKYKPIKSKPIEQQRNKGSKKTDCKWHVNLTQVVICKIIIMEANNASQQETEHEIEIPTVNILDSELEGLDSTKYPSLINPTELSIGSRFNSWEIAKHYLKEYGRQRGFIYKPIKSKPIEQQRNKGSKKTDCKWHVNLSKPEGSDFVHITFMHLEHNHEILIDNTRFATTFRKFDQSIVNEIERAVVYGHCDVYTIRNLLQPLYPDQLFLTQDLSNTIQKIKREKQIAGSDASYLLKLLFEQQKEEPMTFVQPLINVDNVILHDNTSRTNKYNFPLSLFILVNNDGKSRLGAQAFLNDETQESYEWVLQQTLNATGIEPKVIITDMNPAMDAAYQTTYNYKKFICDFWKTRNSLCAEVFKERFQTLLNNFPNGNSYLYDPIYSTRYSWACAFTNRVFTAGMQSTQRVESINAIIHKVVSSSSTIANVAEALDSQMQKEELNKSFIAWKYQSTIYHQPFVVENFFSNINIIIQKYFSPRIVEGIHKQMCESVLYRCEKLDIDNAFEFIEDQSNQNEIYENQISDDQEEIHNIENYYDYRQTYLRALLNSVQKEKIKEVWQIIPYMVPKLYQHIILLDDGTHLCTCLLLVSRGIICRHYFKLMIENSGALFHIMLMPTRWLQDNAWDNIDLIFNEHFVRTSSKNLKPIHNDDDSQRAYLIPKYHNNIQEVEIRRHTQKKINYGRIMGHFKQALNYSLDDNDQENLDILEDKNSIDELKMPDGRIYDVDSIENPVKRQGKGRPAVKRLKACGEQKNKADINKVQKENVYEEDGKDLNDSSNVNKHKCGLCHKIGHYSPKCPNK